MATQLDLAEAQFIGFNHARINNRDIVGLVEGMGLTKKEWDSIKRKRPYYLNDDEIEDIDSYFNKKDR